MRDKWCFFRSAKTKLKIIFVVSFSGWSEIEIENENGKVRAKYKRKRNLLGTCFRSQFSLFFLVCIASNDKSVTNMAIKL